MGSALRRDWMTPDASALDIACVKSDHCSGVKGPNERGWRLDWMTPEASAFDIACVKSDHCSGVKGPNERGSRLEFRVTDAPAFDFAHHSSVYDNGVALPERTDRSGIDLTQAERIDLTFGLNGA